MSELQAKRDRLDTIYRTYLHDMSRTAAAVKEACVIGRALEEDARAEALREVRALFVHAFMTHPTGRLNDVDAMGILDAIERRP